MLILPSTDAKMSDMIEVKGELETKTKSQRLRSVIFLVWKQSNDGKTFDQFYDDYMEKLITKWKQKIEDK